MKTTFRNLVALSLASLLATAANAGVFTTVAAQMGAIDNPGTIPIGVPALSVVNAPTTFLSISPTVGYTYSTDGSTNFSAGLFPDYHFLGSAGATPPAGAIWTFASLATEYYRYATIDHTPLPTEALESSLWGSNNGGSTWILGTVAEIYEQGWDPLGLPEDGSTRWVFSSPVNMISDVVGLTQGVVGSPLPPYSYGDGDYETDAVMQKTPEPASIVMAAVGMVALGVARWRRRR
jgi:hypothetical protein